MLKQFEGLKKKNFCVELNKKFYKHGERTTCVAKMAIPIPWWMPVKSVLKMFPELRKSQNFTTKLDDCMILTVKATCCPSGGDEYDEKKGETIAYSKCQRKAYRIAARVLEKLSDYLAEESGKFERASAFMSLCYERENNFLNTI